MVASLLGAGLESEESRIRRSEVPRSTYQDVKRRLFHEAILGDRYIPEPQLLGWDSLSIAIARPLADRVRAVGQRWGAHPSAVVVWRGVQSVVGLFLSSSAEEAAKLKPDLVGDDLALRTPLLTCDLRAPTVPVYFDFEGVWRNLSGTGRPTRYPRSLGGLDPGQVARVRQSRPYQRAIRSLLDLNRSDEQPEKLRAPHLRGPPALPRSFRRALKKGWTQWRVLPSLGRVLGPPGVDLEEVLMIHGEVRTESRPRALFDALARDSRTFPFLFLTDGRAVVLGGLGVRRNPSAAASPHRSSRRSVMGVLQDHLASVDVVRERVSGVTLVTDHRYPARS